MRLIAFGFAALVGGSLLGALPTPDNVVVVIEENHSAQSIWNNPDAAWINNLANTGANFTNFYAITHPSQPNYLEMFSGSSQGITDDALPTGLPFATSNLASALRSAGATFGGYSEDLPSIGSNIET